MRRVLQALVVLQALLPLAAIAANEKVLLEINSVESAADQQLNKSRLQPAEMIIDPSQLQPQPAPPTSPPTP